MHEDQSPENKFHAYMSTKEHIDEVRKHLRIIVGDLLERGDNHDHQKLEEPEFEVFTKFTKRLKDITYGSEEYMNCIQEMMPALEHHYSVSPHHPEYYQNGIDGMNLVDLVEMFCDWWASSKRHSNGNIMNSLDINKERFNICPQLLSILKNTVAYMNDKAG
jgi:hypothetical protein